MSAPRLNRQLHRLGAILIALPLLVVIGSGLFLQVKKQWSFVQPPTQRGMGTSPGLSFDEILDRALSVPEAAVAGWEDIDRLDVRPEHGLIKVRCKNRWELQLDARTGELLSSAYRRSDLIESIHDGSFFHERAKLIVFLPVGVVLLGLWASGVYLFALPYLVRRRRKNGDL